MGHLSHERFLVGKQIALDIVEGWIAVGSSESICEVACNFVESYPLRAAHALQLAAAYEFCSQQPDAFPFVTADQRLADAARQTGFSVEFL
jgi:predicted nucleic acid-binding protein